MPGIRIVGLWRYPVKGLGGESLGEIAVSKADGVAGDRRYAFAHDASAFDPAAPAWKPKAEFLQLARDPGLAPLSARWESASDSLTLVRDFGAGDSITARPESADGRVRLERFLDHSARLERRPGGRLVSAGGVTFSDTGRPVVSIISVATVAAIADAAGRRLDPRRFRGNLIIDGAEPWAEFDWIGSKMWAGSVLLNPVERIGRCPATSVNPDTGEVDFDVPQFLRQRFGHHQCGVYAEIATSGRISVGNAVMPLAG